MQTGDGDLSTVSTSFNPDTSCYSAISLGTSAGFFSHSRESVNWTAVFTVCHAAHKDYTGHYVPDLVSTPLMT